MCSNHDFWWVYYSFKISWFVYGYCSRTMVFAVMKRLISILSEPVLSIMLVWSKPEQQKSEPKSLRNRIAASLSDSFWSFSSNVGRQFLNAKHIFTIQPAWKLSCIFTAVRWRREESLSLPIGRCEMQIAVVLFSYAGCLSLWCHTVLVRASPRASESGSRI